MAQHHFNVSSRIALLLGESYKKIEQALKELVDNSWDADARTVRIEVPEGPEAKAAIVISDDGEGMSPEQIDKEYLRIADLSRAFAQRFCYFKLETRSGL